MATRHTTRTAKSDATSIVVRGHDLMSELIGHRTFTEMLYFHATDRWPTVGQTKALDACLVTLMEHGLTPSAIVARLIADSVPGEAQVAIAAGLLAVGSVFVGTMEGTARLLASALAAKEGPDVYLRQQIVAHKAEKRSVPGFGHPQHKPDDPRSPRLFEVVREVGVAGPHVALIQELSKIVDETYGRHLTINATGAIGAILLDIGIPVEAIRSIAVVSRSGGLVGHLLEERKTGSARDIWHLVEEAIPYAES